MLSKRQISTKAKQNHLNRKEYEMYAKCDVKQIESTKTKQFKQYYKEKGVLHVDTYNVKHD